MLLLLLMFSADHLYPVLNQFLLCKPTLNLDTVPEFYKLFNSSAIEVHLPTLPSLLASSCLILSFPIQYFSTTLMF